MCIRDRQYFGEISRALKVRLAENKKNFKEGKTNLPKLAEIGCDDLHKILWNQVDNVGRETNNNKRKIIESSFMAVSANCRPNS